MFVEVSVLDHLILDRNHLTNKRNCMFAPLSCVLFSSSGLDRVLCPYMYWSWECPGSFQWSWQNQMSFQQLWQLTGLIVRKGKTCHFTCATRIGLTVCHLFASLESVVCMPLVWVRPPPSGKPTGQWQSSAQNGAFTADGQARLKETPPLPVTRPQYPAKWAKRHSETVSVATTLEAVCVPTVSRRYTACSAELFGKKWDVPSKARIQITHVVAARDTRIWARTVLIVVR